jgi:hypothetical protein
MPQLNESSIAEFDADAVWRAVREAVEGQLLSFTEFDREGLNVLYAAEETLDYYGSEAEMLEHFEEIHSYINIDFTEQELFTESLFPEAEQVEYLVTALDFVKLLRVYHGDVGLYIALEPDEPILPLVEAVRATVAG